MKKIEAASLEEAYAIACDELGCSVAELKYEIVQYPSKGVFGLFAKPAIIVADVRRYAVPEPKPVRKTDAVEAQNVMPAREGKSMHPKSSETMRDAEETVLKLKTEKVEKNEKARKEEERTGTSQSEEEILDGFFNARSEVSEIEKRGSGTENPDGRDLRLQREIEEVLKDLMARSCFDIDVVEVDVIDRTAYIFIDGEDAALIIGKEGYRYNALSYLLYNWIHSQYDLYVKLEIARFLSSQEEMIRNGLQSVIEHIEREGWGRTRPLDGILVQIALEQLRERFPDKYVAVKRQRDGKRYILVNPFNSRK